MAQSNPIRLLLVDDHIIVREGLVTMLSTSAHVQVIGQAADGEEALRFYEQLKPDVVVMDVRLPGIDGLETLQRLKTSHPKAMVLMLAGSSLPHEVQLARRLGAVGFLSKDVECEDLLQAIQQVFRGKVWVGGALSHAAVPELTEREFQVLESARRGLSNADIGKMLSISEHTVKSHVKTLLRKLHAADRAEAVARGFELGLLR